jgi:isocitrate lyase
MSQTSAGAQFRKALTEESPLQVIGTINANHALLAKRAGFKAIYLSGGGVAAGSLGIPDLGITGLEDVLVDVRRITDVCDTPLLVDIDTGFGASAFNIARSVRSINKAGAAAIHIEDQVGAKRCGHRPNKELVSKDEMVDRIKAAVDARVDDSFVIMARTDALAVEGIDALFIGPADLSFDLKARSSSLSYDDCVAAIAKAAKTHQKGCGILVRHADDQAKLLSMGFTWLAMDSDLSLLREGFRRNLVAARI